MHSSSGPKSIGLKPISPKVIWHKVKHKNSPLTQSPLAKSQLAQRPVVQWSLYYSTNITSPVLYMYFHTFLDELAYCRLADHRKVKLFWVL
jgi:hypothetical protein